MKTSSNIEIIKSNGQKEPFDVLKLENSLMRTGVKPEFINRITDHVLLNLKPGMSTQEIYRHAYTLLDSIKKDSAVKYSLRRAVSELGPTGFPFEKFVAEIFNVQGFQTLTDVVVNGQCVEHEIDIIAYNDSKLIMSEAKFHNELGVKSDLKVVLYVKARIDDLKLATFDFGKKGRKLDEGWIITNTKFTTTAIKYALCQDIKLVGWNYPATGNLHHMIEEAKLQPLTALTTLNNNEKRNLLTNGVVLCTALEKEQKFMKELGIKPDKISTVLKEVEEVCNV